jgi:hypothetical protein
MLMVMIMQKSKFENEQKRAMKEAHLGQARQTKLCKCGHLKDEHAPIGSVIVCTNMDCKCVIDFD